MARRRAAAGRRYVPFALLALVGGLTIGLLLSRPPVPAPSAAPTGPAPQVPALRGAAPAPVAQPAPAGRPGPVPPPAVAPAAPSPRSVRPAPTARVALIFDDAGGSLGDIEAIIALGRPATVAVLPGLRFSREVAERARAAGLEVFLHLPLEADDPTKSMGPGGIAIAMSDEEIAAAVRSGLASVPGAVGVNNHMGSKGTADLRVMRAVLATVKAEGLIWVDSVTSLRTVGARVAGEMGIATASRHVFLDNEDDPEAIRTQVTRLIDIARRQGEAVAIGHAQKRTAQVLREMLGEFDSAGIELVPVSALAR